MGRIRDFLRHAFAVESAGDFQPNDEQQEVIDKLAKKVVAHGMTVPALLFLESVRPMNFIGSQVMAFFEPIIRGLLDWRGYSLLQDILQKRESVSLIMDRIEYFENLSAENKAKSSEAKKETQ